jgi:large subunit ribosomal protein L33
MAKGKSVLIRLLSNAGTGYYYVYRKNPKNAVAKLQLIKYDPIARKHVLFSESKFKK